MLLAVGAGNHDDHLADALVVCATTPVPPNLISTNAEQLSSLAFVLASGEFRGEEGEAVLVHTGADDFPRLLLIGLGPKDALDIDSFRTAGALAARTLERVGGSLRW